ncbi:DUF2207 domain-containing protein [Microbacterium sp. ARD32]|uniref:DUF2207 family protein n=1 Tax=Microbacterium sp. ARD32 TaxID=2962577 RepID=UPI0028812FD8|nr:DUF2207 domain-containing protein [Microbacterium sp. ARD32]MDT0156169.1 DUF2207 domain-containing protein [Microbacterium sp. ARD32]
MRPRLRAFPHAPAAPHASPASHAPAARHASARLVAMLALALGLLATVLLPASAASADVDDFSYSSWDSDYRISLDDHGRAVAHVTETLVAEFPDTDQNKGIIRGYPQRYEGAGLSVRILSVKDAEGHDVPYETETEDGMLLVLTGDDDYVHGPTTYVIESTMHDFMIHGGESGNDEFYWNLLPLNSTQDIGRFQATMTFSTQLADALTGDTACYGGRTGERAPCTLEGPERTSDGATFTVRSAARAAGDGVTVAIGFTSATVTQPDARRADPVADFGAAAFGLGSIATAIGAWVAVAVRARRRRRATGVVVAQFDVPAELPPLAAAPLIPAAPNPVPAQLVHLAVTGAVRLEEDPTDARKRPSLRRLHHRELDQPLDRATIESLFPGENTVRRIPKSSTRFAKRMTRLVAKGRTAAERNGWLTAERSGGAMAFGWVAIALFLATLGFFISAAMKDRDLLGLSFLALLAAGIVVTITSFFAFAPHTVLTPDGALQYEYLMGVKEFIRVAEADRLRMLQSYRGADRGQDGTVDVVHLYEKLLPYAMLFGEEKSWTAVLETTYSASGSSPGWMDVAAGVSISSRLSHYSTSMNTAATYTPSSSSGGGSTGGGFSGGGGGGGFSGGR